MGRLLELFHKRNSRGWRLEGEEKKGLSERCPVKRSVAIVRMNAQVRPGLGKLQWHPGDPATQISPRLLRADQRSILVGINGIVDGSFGNTLACLLDGV
jgi:hypothetical protein